MKLYHVVKLQIINNQYDPIGFGILLAYTAVIVNFMATVDQYGCVLLIVILAEYYLHQQSIYRIKENIPLL
jgi:hypothetical protein